MPGSRAAMSRSIRASALRLPDSGLAAAAVWLTGAWAPVGDVAKLAGYHVPAPPPTPRAARARPTSLPPPCPAWPPLPLGTNGLTGGEGDADAVVGPGERGRDDPRLTGVGQLPVRHPPQHLPDHHADLEPGQVRAEAEV